MATAVLIAAAMIAHAINPGNPYLPEEAAINLMKLSILYDIARLVFSLFGGNSNA